MRVKVENKSTRPDEIVIALAEYAATFFPHVTGVVPVIVKNAKSGRPHGMCYGRRRCVIWIERIDNGKIQYPKTYDQMHYFRHANQSDVKPLTVMDWKEHLLAIIAHEMEHTTKGNIRMRRSRQEINAWNREVEVLEAFRMPENSAKVEERIKEILSSGVRKIEKAEFKKSPEYKISQIDALLTKWCRKAKLAQTKIKKLKTRMKYFERKQAASGKACMVQENGLSVDKLSIVE